MTLGCGGGGGGSDPDATTALPADAAVSGVDGAAGPDAAPPDAAPTPLPPVAGTLALRVELNDAVSATAPGSDPNGDTLTYRVVTPPLLGTLTAFDPATGAFTYAATTTAPANDSFTYQVNDGALDATSPGLVTLELEPVLFTGSWSLANLVDNGTTACTSSGSFRIGHAGPDPVTPGQGLLEVGQRRITCGSTTWTFDPFRVTASASNLSATQINVSQSRFVSGCGTVTDQFRLTRTATGFAFQETAIVPCSGIGTHVLAGDATRVPIAYLFALPTPLAFGQVFVGDNAGRSLTVRNVGPVEATALAVTGLAAPFGYLGGAYPGAGGDCGATVAARSSCRLELALDTTTSGLNLSGTVNVGYHDGLGSAATSSALSGAVVPRVTGATAVAAGNDFQCVLDSVGVQCWGRGGSGQLVVPALTTPVAITAGDSHACAIDATGVHCWGANGSGQSTVPTLANPRAVSAGGVHTCALDDTGAHCWGGNSAGQTAVPALVNPIQISAGSNHTCALDAAGVQCWGSNSAGQLTVPALTNPRAVSAGNTYSCALDDSGVRCWGSDTFGRATPPALTAPTALSAGGVRACALASSSPRCWGFGASSNPVINGMSALSTGYNHACGIVSGGALRCWGTMTYP